jgi:serine/threonine protein kinase
VYIALNATTGEMIAAKQVETSTAGNDMDDGKDTVTKVLRLKLESETLKDLDHQNVVQYLGFEEISGYLTMFAIISHYY